MSKAITVALDAMGGDHGTQTVVPAAIGILGQRPELRIILVGDEDTLVDCLKQQGQSVDSFSGGRLRIHHTSQVVAMDESPALALRGKKDSSMRVAINLVKQGEADACVSAGNTGALMATARFVLKMLPGIDRPAIISSVPSMDGHTHMLDLGANVSCSSEQLFQFALMGSELAKAVENIEQPKVGLLNVGAEDIKGNKEVKGAAALLGDKDCPVNYIGFVEGDDIYQGGVDVVVCDGFVGNVSLKSAEGVAKMISGAMKTEFTRGVLGKLMGLVAYPALKRIRSRFDPRVHNGASFLGVRGIVIKSHGGADPLAFHHAVELAVTEVKKGVTARIEESVVSYMAQRKAAG